MPEGKVNYSKVWSETHGAVCSLTCLQRGDRISSGTGFMIGRKLVTNNHVIQIPADATMEVCFVDPDGHTPTLKKTLSAQELRNRLQDGEAESSWDYAILDASDFPQAFSLKISPNDGVHIGSDLVWLGFQFEQTNLSIHSGMLSSKYVQAGVNYLQLDGSVNQGNSGGPLINPSTGEVIGIITRKATGLTRQFDELIQAFEQTAIALQNTPVVMSVDGIDPIKILAVTQTQMRRVSMEIKRSANVGIGYAYEIKKIRHSLEHAA